jgi:hypothetical protein
MELDSIDLPRLSGLYASMTLQLGKSLSASALYFDPAAAVVDLSIEIQGWPVQLLHCSGQCGEFPSPVIVLRNNSPRMGDFRLIMALDK